MTRGYTAGLLITGNADGAVKAVKLTEEQLSKLNVAQKTASSYAKDYTSQLEGMGTKLGSTVKQVGYLAAGLAAAGAATLLFFKHGLDAGDALGRMSDKINVSTESLAAMRLTAELAGVSTGQLDKLAQKMTINIGKAALQGGQAASAFKTLGLNVAELAKLPADKQMAAIADAMENVGNATVRAQLAVQIFGKQGLELLPVLVQGGAAIREQAHQAEVLGLTLSKIDTVKMDAAGDAIQLAEKATEGFTQQLSLRFSGAIQLAAERLFQMGEEAGGVGTIATKAFNSIVDALGETANFMQRVFQGFKIIALGIETIMNAAQRAYAVLQHMSTQAKEGAATELAQRQKQLDEARRSEPQSIAQGNLAARTDELAAAEKRLFDARERYAQGGSDAIQSIRARGITDLENQKNALTQEIAGLQQAVNQGLADGTMAESAYVKELQRRVDVAKVALDMAPEQATVDDNYAKRIAELDGNLEKTGNSFKALLGDTSRWRDSVVVFFNDANRASDENAKRILANNKKIADSMVIVSQEQLKAKKKADDEYDKQDKEFWDGVAMTRDADYAEQTATAKKAAAQIAKDQKAAAKEVADFWEHATSRIDSAFADMWKGAFDSFEDFRSNMQEAFKQLLAELAHAAITKPIVLYFQQQLSGVGSVPTGGGAGSPGGSFDILKNIFNIGKPGTGAGGGGTGGAPAGMTSVLGSLGTSLSGMFSTAATWVGQKLISAGLTTVGTSVFNAGAGQAVGQLGPLNYAGAAGTGTAIPSPILSAGNVAGGLIGGYFGNKLGESAFNRQANPYVGATAQAGGAYAGAAIGASYGGVGGPIGAAIGAAIGALVSVAAGSDKAGQRVKLGISAGPSIATGSHDNQTSIGASGLSLSAVGKRLDKESGEALDQLLETFKLIDTSLTDVAREAGVKVDFSGLNLTNINPAGREAGANFFGSFRKGEIKPEDVQGAADDFVKSWIAQIDAQLPPRVRAGLKGVEQTADKIVEAFAGLSNIDKLLKLDVIGKTDEALEALGKANATLLEQYGDLTEAVLEVGSTYDGSVESITKLSTALTAQKSIAVELAVAYRTAGEAVKTTFGSAIDFISESVLSEEDLYKKRSDQIADLTAQLSNTIDPEKIASISGAIDQLARGAFGLLDEDQQKGMAQGFVDFLENVQNIAQTQIAIGQTSLQGREGGVNQSVDLDIMNQAAQTQAASVEQFSVSVNQFAGVVTQLPAALQAALTTALAGGSVPFAGLLSNLNPEVNSVL